VVGHRSAQRCGALPLGHVATVAIGGWHRGSRVAKVAGHGGVRAGQRETGGRVIKRCPEPRSCGVAGGARRRISGGDVIRDGPA
jgi:hypothetical protein